MDTDNDFNWEKLSSLSVAYVTDFVVDDFVIVDGSDGDNGGCVKLTLMANVRLG